MPTKGRVELFSLFGGLEDPRVERTRAHSLLDLVSVALCAAIAGADSWADVERFGHAKIDFFRSFLALPNGIPSHDTFGRVFARLDPARFARCLAAFLDLLGVEAAGQVVAIDGKTLRGSYDRAAGKSPLHLVTAWAADARLVLGQVATDAKSNEIKAIPELLDLLDLAGATVTIDAMGCQKEIAAKIRDRGADDVLALKGNHPTLAAEVEAAFVREAEAGFAGRGVRRLVQAETGHGRKERREYTVMPAPAGLAGRSQWRDLNAVGMVVRLREIDGKETGEVSFFLSSLAPKAKEFARAVRGHWGIENRLHWSLDVTFSEDASRRRKGNGPEIAGCFRRLALSILQRDTSCRASLRGKRLLAGWNNDVLAKILAGFSST